MAVENVMMMNVVGKIDYVDRFAKDIFLFNDIQIVDAMNEIDTGRFTLPICEEHLGELLGFAQLVPGESMMDEKTFIQKVQKLDELYEHSLTIDMKKIQSEDINLSEVLERVDYYEKNLSDEYAHLKEAEEKLHQIKTSIEAYTYLEEIDVPMEALNQMQYFKYTIGSVSKDNAARLKSIYNTVTSIVFHVGDTKNNEEVFMIVSPTDFEVETNRILKALNFRPVDGYDDQYTDTPKRIVEMLNDERKALEKDIDKTATCLKQHQDEKREDAEELYNILTLYANLNIIKKYMAFSDNNFYFSGWVPRKERAKLEKIAGKYEDLIIIFNDPDKMNKPPTKLKNNWVFKPFEALVKMYGVPAYNELDPTPFLSITYLFCFGFMFGDVGQGLVLLLAGIILGRRGVVLGNVLSRMACSSIVFGFIYGSIFGNETLLPAIWVKPFDNIMTVLATAVVLGVLMLLVAYVYSIVNKLRQGDIKEGFFGKNGIAGLLLYLSILVTALAAVGYVPVLKNSIPFLVGLCIVLVILVLFREPIANTIRKRKLYDTSAGDYYVEAGFELLEMFLSMLSNTLSFIRVGAFALTHVGLFMAFETLAEMVGGGLGGIVCLIIGNILVIGLEGLIDFIQCLRLQFYELFSKYYSGDGDEFMSVNAELKSNI